ncbi:MAG: Cof-type HAD-IIB family hydrolase [Lachnospiraceae bacterium]|nr:Cof-type HAD-IIB family hydrolase [Lachnospiraceae bacterium]
MIRLIASDMDGTLLNNQGQLSEETVRQIKEIQQKGVIFAICTGRIFNSAKKELEKNGIQCSYLCNSGAQIIDENGEVIRSIPLERETAEWVITMFESWGVSMDIQTESQFFVTWTAMDMVRKAWHFWKQGRLLPFLKRNFSLRKQKDSPIHLKKASDVFQYSDQIFKISSGGISPEKVEKMKRYFRHSGKVTAVSSFPDNVEVTDSRAQKGASLAWYAKNLGIPMSEVMAVGDSDNDLSMIEMDFGYTVAMGNAMDCIKKAAKYETLTNEEDGVAAFIKKYVD